MRGMFAESMTVGDAMAWGASRLDESDTVAGRSRADATLLLRHVLKIPQAELYAYRERPLGALETEKFNALIRARAKGEPIQYLTGEQEFFGLRFRVTPDVLIPRPETEHLVEAAIARLQAEAAPRIVDVGTGSGAIAVALAHGLPRCQVTALDLSDAALALAAENAVANKVAERIRLLRSDLLAAVEGETFSAIISNPPYIALTERSALPVEVREYEPALALFAGVTGLEIFERLVVEARPRLLSGGWLMMEIGYGQREAVEELLRGWSEVEFVQDLQGIARVVTARKS